MSQKGEKNKTKLENNKDLEGDFSITNDLDDLIIKKIPWWLWGIFLFLASIIITEIVYLIFMFQQKRIPVEPIIWQNEVNLTDLIESVGFSRYIDGVMIEEEDKVNLWPAGVMIDNMLDARPPFGLDKANLVIESLAEASITRFLAFFDLGETIDKIGPVRSARPYFAEWASELGAVYVHSGGSPEALAKIKAGVYDIYDLNEFYNGNDFWRDRNRYAPHNLLTSSELLATVVARKVGDQSANYSRFVFKNEKAIDERGDEATEFEIYYNETTHLVKWIYDREANDYIRYQAGQKHLTADGTEIKAKNVVIQYVEMEILDSVGRKRIKTIDNKLAIIFQDGQKIEGYWQKENSQSRTKFYTKDGQEISFNRGITWIEVVPVGYEVQD
jgi:hypothetical protein